MSSIEHMQQLLREHWGYDSWRPLQQEAMNAVLSGEDSLVVLPTGGGKSLCFQAPALALEGTAIVVTPLISLMKDQVDMLRELGIPAGKLHSGQDQEEAFLVSHALEERTLKLLYVSPERLIAEGFSRVVRGAPVSFLAIDEAHCISEWGHDFRPEYRRLSEFREAFPKAAIHAYTATATPRVANDIRKQLRLRDPHTLIGSFDRPNLLYRVEPRVSAADQVATIARRHNGESGIVYCISRKDTERIADELNMEGLNALPYHAGLDDITRENTQNAFTNDEVPIIVATVAFGMGIDKPDVRFVAHAGMPKSLENYQQESGRAGRDGLGAECVLLYSAGDFMKWKFILDKQPPDQARISLEKIRAVERYCETWTCRRKSLLAYFGEQYPKDDCSTCDVCAGEVTPLEDSLVIAQKIMSCVKRLDEQHGPAHTVKVLTASADKRILAEGHDQLTTYGLLREFDRTTIRAWIGQLTLQGLLTQADDKREAPLAVTPRGWEVLRGKLTPILMHADPKRKRVAPREMKDWSGVDKDLFEHLRELRATLARDRNVPPYVVFGDRTLRELAREQPATRQAMKALHGIGDAKMKHYGATFLAAIRKWRKNA